MFDRYLSSVLFTCLRGRGGEGVYHTSLSAKPLLAAVSFRGTSHTLVHKPACDFNMIGWPAARREFRTAPCHPLHACSEALHPESLGNCRFDPTNHLVNLNSSSWGIQGLDLDFNGGTIS